MTTPERLRRRQRREEIMLIVLGLAVGLASIYFHDQDVKQRECITHNFGSLTSSLSARGEIAQRESRASKLEGRATRLESKANNRFYQKAFAATEQAEFFAAYGNYKVKLAQVEEIRTRVDKRRAQIAEDRAENPIPDFPEGTCA